LQGPDAQYPVIFEAKRPERFQRRHVLLRIAMVLVLSLMLAFSWFVVLVYLTVPVVAAAFVSRDKGRYLEQSGELMRRFSHWLVAFDAYITYLTDRLPLEDPEDVVRYEVRMSGTPTPGSALLRLVYSIPHGLVLLVLGFVIAPVTWVAAAVFILLTGSYPDALYRFHTGVVRWTARLLAYHASLTDEYPPFALSDDPRRPEPHLPPASAGKSV
jgi:hypothetical protein